MIIHLTHAANLRSIEERGILSPEQAERVGARTVLGSQGSNRKAVQLFDLGGADPHHIQNLLDGVQADAAKHPAHAGISVEDLMVIVIGDVIADDPSYKSASKVTLICREQASRGVEPRHWPHFEAWCDGPVPPSSFVTVVAFCEWARVHGSKRRPGSS